MLLGHAAAAVAEEDPLDPPGHQDTVANHKQTLRAGGGARRNGVPPRVSGGVRAPPGTKEGSLTNHTSIRPAQRVAS
jgi:hypothetical protein